MRSLAKNLSILLLLCAFSILFVSPVKAGCSFDAYYNCVGTCSCPAGYCGSCQCKRYSHSTCSGDTSGCYPCPTNTPTSADSRAEPTATEGPTPTIGGIVCPPQSGGMGTCRNATEWCMSQKCGCTCTNQGLRNCNPSCSSSCQSGHCHTTQPGSGDVNCNGWGPWGACLSGQETCAACAAWGYTCQTRFCADPPNSNQYQISCGCSHGGGGGGGGGGGSNPTNTPTPTPTRTPTPTPTTNPNWVKLKNTSFYTSRALTQSIPSAPISYDQDDDGSPYFIIASPTFDPGAACSASL